MRFDGGDDLGRLGHAAGAEFAAGHLAVIGADEGDAVALQVSRHCAGSPHGVHMRTFIAGAISTGLSVASSAVEARSSARPCAILAMRSAVAGATTTKIGGARQFDMAHLDLVGEAEQSRVDLLAGERGNRQAASRIPPPRWVMMARTRAAACFSRRISSRLL